VAYRATSTRLQHVDIRDRAFVPEPSSGGLSRHFDPASARWHPR